MRAFLVRQPIETTNEFARNKFCGPTGLTHVDRIQKSRGRNRYSQTRIQPIDVRSRTRDRDLRLRTITCCRSTRISASSLARDFSRDRTTSRNLIRNSTIGVRSSQSNWTVTPDQVFGIDSRSMSALKPRCSSTCAPE